MLLITCTTSNRQNKVKVKLITTLFKYKSSATTRYADILPPCRDSNRRLSHDVPIPALRKPEMTHLHRKIIVKRVRSFTGRFQTVLN